MTNKKEAKQIVLKDIVKDLGITERKARKILRESSINSNHQYFWMFSEKQVNNVIRYIESHKED